MAIGPEMLLSGAKVELVATMILGGRRFPAGEWIIEYSAIEQDAEAGRPAIAAAMRSAADLVDEKDR